MFIKYQKGKIAEIRVQLRATELGWITSIPTLESRYDMILDDGSKLYKVQVKYCDTMNENDALCLDLRSQTRNNGISKKYTADEIDVILAYLPQLNEVLWIGSNLFDNASSLCFRLNPPKNSYTKGTRMAKDFIW